MKCKERNPHVAFPKFFFFFFFLPVASVVKHYQLIRRCYAVVAVADLLSQLKQSKRHP